MGHHNNTDELNLSPEQKQKLEARREYQRQYYQAHKEKAKEYQRQYNLTHKKKKGPRGSTNQKAVREAIRRVMNSAEFMTADAVKAAKMLQDVLDGKRGIVI